MLIASRPASDPVANALARIADRGIAVEPWMADGQSRSNEPLHQPVLYLVEPDAPPPHNWGGLEDWVRLPVTTDELYARADALMTRAWAVGAIRIEVDDDDVLHVGTSLAILSRYEARLLRLLIARRGDVVTREVATETVWPDGPPDHARAIDSRLRDLRAKLHGLPIQVRTVRARGFSLEWDPECPA